MRMHGEVYPGPKAITVIAVPKGQLQYGIGFIADNGLQGLDPASLRVATHDEAGWHVDHNIIVDSAKPKPVVRFPSLNTIDGISIQRETGDAVEVGWDAS